MIRPVRRANLMREPRPVRHILTRLFRPGLRQILLKS